MIICHSTHNNELPQFKIVATRQLKQQQISRCWKRHTQIPLGSPRSGKNLSQQQYPVASNVEMVVVERERGREGTEAGYYSLFVACYCAVSCLLLIKVIFCSVSL